MNNDLFPINSKNDGWEHSIPVSGITPKLAFREAIIGCMVDNGYIESADDMTAIDDWHFQVEGEISLWKKKESFLADKLNEALKDAGWNVLVAVKFESKDDESFIIDLSDHSFPPYFLMLCYDDHYQTYDNNVDATRDKDEFYLRLIYSILKATKDTDERIEQISNLLEGEDMITDEKTGDEYSIVEIHPQLLLRDGIIAGDYGLFDSVELVYPEFPDRDNYQDEDEYEEALQDFKDGLDSEGLYTYSLSIIANS